MVPIGVIKLHESHAALDESPREQAVVGEGRLARLGTIHVERLFGLVFDARQFGSRRLHRERHLVGLNASCDLRIADISEPQIVELSQRVDEVGLALAADAIRTRQVQNRVAAAAERHPLIRRRQKPARPERVPSARTARSRLQHDEARQVLGFAPQSVGDPGSHAWPAGGIEAAVHEELRRPVIEDVGLHAANPTDVVDDALVMGQTLTQVHAAFAVLAERAIRAEQFRFGLQECKTPPFEQFRRRILAVILVECGLGIEQFEMTRPSGHEQIDDVLDLRREVRLIGG